MKVVCKLGTPSLALTCFPSFPHPSNDRLPASPSSDHVIVPTTAYNNMVFVKGWAERFPRTTFWGLEGVELEGAKFTRDLTMEVRSGRLFASDYLIPFCHLVDDPIKYIKSDSFPAVSPSKSQDWLLTDDRSIDRLARAQKTWVGHAKPCHVMSCHVTSCHLSCNPFVCPPVSIKPVCCVSIGVLCEVGNTALHYTQ